MIDPREALQRLKTGNKRFVANARQVDPHGEDHAVNENPIAIILGCCDHRVPPDILFDTGLGNLFSIRVAGNIVTPTQLGSIEFGAITFGPRLLVVMGHSRCGAVQATLQAHIDKRPPPSPHLVPIVEEITPACTRCLEGASGEGLDEAAFEDLAVRVTHENIANSIHALRTQSQILDRLVREEGLMIVGAYYDMVSGQVRFLDEA